MRTDQIKHLLELSTLLSTMLQEMDTRKEILDENVHLVDEVCNVQDVLSALFEDGGHERIHDRLVYVAKYFNIPMQSTKV